MLSCCEISPKKSCYIIIDIFFSRTAIIFDNFGKKVQDLANLDTSFSALLFSSKTQSYFIDDRNIAWAITCANCRFVVEFMEKKLGVHT